MNTQDDETTSEQPVCDFEEVNKKLSDILHQLMDRLFVCNNTEGKKNSYMQKLTLVHSYFHKFTNKSYTCRYCHSTSKRSVRQLQKSPVPRAS